MKPFDWAFNTYSWHVWQIFMKPPAARIPIASFKDGPFEKSPHETCFPSSFIENLRWLCFNTLRISGPSVLFPSSPTVISVVRRSWFWRRWRWKRVSDTSGLCAGAPLSPQRTTVLFLQGQQKSMVSQVLEPDLLSRITAGSDGEQRFCEWPRRILVTFRCLTGAVSCMKSSSRGCNCLQAPDRPHVHSSS